ncbi:DNA polymerase III subunit gamma/tau [Candidatus Neomarinimicrobiota bacterium]
MSYQVLSRKWRPQRFEELIGQSHVAQTLQNALERGRVAHAYIFTGPRGVGKTSTARILAKALNCPNTDGTNPCNDCQICQEITRGNSMDVLEIDGASNRGIDEIRELREAAKYPPTTGNYRIYIIDEVHMLTTQAFNALLKTLEEPPGHIKFIMATTDPQKVPQTILSRTQRFDFRRIPTPDIVALLEKILDEEDIPYEVEALTVLARKGDGSIRDGLSLLDQVIAYHSGKIDEATVTSVLGLIEDAFYAGLLESIAGHDRKAVLSKVEAIFDGGYDIKEICQGVNQFLRDGIMSLETGDPSLTTRGTLVEVPNGITTPDLINLLNIGLETEAQLRYAQQPRVLIEHQLLKMAELDKVVSIQEVLDELKTPGASRPVESPPPKVQQVKSEPSSDKTRPPTKREEESHSEKTTSEKRTFSRKPAKDPEDTDLETEPDTEDAPQPIPTDALGKIQEKWSEVITEVGKKSQGTAATLAESVVAHIEGNNLIMHLPASQSIHLKMLMDKRTVVEDAIQDIFAWRVRILPTIPETPSQDPHSTRAASRGNAVMDELIETFKGEEY